MANFRFRRRNGSSAELLDQPLPLDDVVSAAYSAIEASGLKLVMPERGPARVFGPPGTLDSFRLTEVWFADGRFDVECVVPVVVPRERLDEALELASALGTQGRAGFAIGERATPVARTTARLVIGYRDVAPTLCSFALDMAWQKAGAAWSLFREVVDGAKAEEVLESVSEERDSELFTLLPIKVHESPSGHEWPGVLDQALPWPDGETPPGEWTADEFRAFTVVAPSLTRPDTPIADACAGPLLIHADGFVECFGCSEPATNRHLEGGSISCSEGLYLGDGHRCERCGETR
jgi:hypothetical protein